MRSIPRWLSSATALTLAAWPIAAGPASATTRAPATARTSHARTASWTAAWTAAPQRPGPSFTPNWSEEGFAHQTIRQIVRVTTGGTSARIRLSNLYGTTRLTVTGATIARTASGAAVQKETLRHLTIKRARTFTIPAGAELASDPVQLRLAPLDSVTVTLYLAGPTGPATYHALAQATGYRAEGDHQADTGAAAFTETTQSWYYLSGLDLTGVPAHRSAIVAFGDSITDGMGSTPNANDRYPDRLAERLASTGRPRAVLNQGIIGNRITVDSAWFGDKATSRFRRDVLQQPGVGTVIILLGINDIGISELAAAPPAPIFAPFTDVSAADVIAGQRDLIKQARARGLRVIGATIMPVKGSTIYTARSEAKREKINTWIRTSGAYDTVVDLARVMASPGDSDTLDPAYDSGDHLHPNDAGYQVMANAINPADLG
ncbi:SGNH/GDSL hydrolase family protein [Actinomadura nitritigenes]|uniref:SGNH/GDSL hydrolase family protein n=1 Tax=Actinomadura nitritigenes TaxID=134602 RepID=UPI003D8A2A2D